MGAGIYKIVNEKTKEFYIGSTIDFDERFRVHTRNLINKKHPNIYLQTDFNTTGSEYFLFKIVEYVTNINELINIEQFYIDNLYPKYNICKTANSCLGIKRSSQTKTKISKHNGRYWKNKKFSNEHKKKISESHVNKKHSESTIEKLSKPFKFISPDNKIVEGKNLNRFCVNNNLNYGNMHQVLHGKQKSCKGWKNYSLHKIL